MDALLPLLKQFWVVWLILLFVGDRGLGVLAQPAQRDGRQRARSRSATRRTTDGRQG